MLQKIKYKRGSNDECQTSTFMSKGHKFAVNFLNVILKKKNILKLLNIKIYIYINKPILSFYNASVLGKSTNV